MQFYSFLTKPNKHQSFNQLNGRLVNRSFSRSYNWYKLQWKNSFKIRSINDGIARFEKFLIQFLLSHHYCEGFCWFITKFQICKGNFDSFSFWKGEFVKLISLFLLNLSTLGDKNSRKSFDTPKKVILGSKKILQFFSFLTKPNKH